MGDRVMVEVQVSGLRVDDRARSMVVLLQEVKGERMLPIWIGHTEAGAIAMALAGRKFERPLTHDLMKLIVEGFHATLERVAVTDLKSNTFLAQLVFERENEVVTVDARPSDSIALALRTQSPIYVAEDLFKSKPALELDSKDGAQRLRDFLEGMDPEDFGNVSP
jgi:bifunctional DNase/RNase